MERHIRKTNKSVLKNKLKTECSERNKMSPTVVIMDGCAVLWTVAWPASPSYVPDFVSHGVAEINQQCKGSAVAHVVMNQKRLIKN